MKYLFITLMLILFFTLSYKGYSKENPSDPSIKKDEEKPVAVIELEKKFPETPKKTEETSGDEKKGNPKIAEISLEKEGEGTQKKEDRLAKAGETLKDGFFFVLDKAKKVVGRCRPIDIIMW